jgi:hypothetical protein
LTTDPLFHNQIQFYINAEQFIVSGSIAVRIFAGNILTLLVELWNHAHALNVRVDLERSVVALDRMKSVVVSVARD